jgi:rRNA-processing protein FCF1
MAFSESLPASVSCVQHRCFIVATCDKDLKRRLRKVRT